MASTKDVPVRCAVITVSDSCSAGTKTDVSGPTLKELLQACSSFTGQVVSLTIVPDNQDEIESELLRLCDPTANISVVLTTGGTGFSTSDTTPEATKAVIKKECTGLVVALINHSLKATPMAALSRLVAGIRHKTLIVNLPGNSKAVTECFEVLEPVLGHAVHLLNDKKAQVVKTHDKLMAAAPPKTPACAKVSISPEKSKVTRKAVADRPRESPYPMVNVDEAVQKVLFEAHQLHPMEVDFMDALGCVTFSDVFPYEAHPPFPASIKDGYAVIAADGSGKRRVVGSNIAGSGETPSIESGTCVRVSTGAPIPPGADAVVQVEDTILTQRNNDEELEIEIKVAPKLDQDIRKVGSDISADECVVKAGTQLGAAELGILAMTGNVRLSVFPKPTVAILSTGNEVCEPTVRDLPYGKIRDCNRAELVALMQQHGFHVRDCGIADDDPDTLFQRVRLALREADILVTSGGVSMGEKDILKHVLVEDFGFTVHFARVFMKPGKPTTFASGVLDGKRKLVFGLPGNPVSAWVTSQLYVLPAGRQMCGFLHPRLPRIRVRVSTDLKLDPRPEFHRAVCRLDANGEQHESNGYPMADSTGPNQMSSRLTNTRTADLLLILPPKTAEKPIVAAGEVVDAIIVGHF